MSAVLELGVTSRVGCPGVSMISTNRILCLIQMIWCNPTRRRKKTLSAYLTKVAQLGGYLARATDSPPGNMVMWRGLSRLTDVERGAMIGAQLVGN